MGWTLVRREIELKIATPQEGNTNKARVSTCSVELSTDNYGGFPTKS